MIKPVVSVVIVSFNTKKLLTSCLTSCLAQKGVSLEIIVVDNASNDGSLEMVRREFPHVLVIRNQKNLGYGSANNLGIKRAKGNFILILNSDTILPPGSIAGLVSWLESHPEASVVGPQLRFPGGKLQTSGGNFPNLANVFILFLGVDDIPLLSRFLPLYQRGGMYLSGKHQSWFKSERPVGWLMGACFLARPEVFRKTGGFDERIFMYMEEVEWFYRAKLAGFRTWYTPKVWIYHLKGGSSSKDSTGAILGEIKGLKHFFKKHKPAWQYTLVTAILKVGALGRVVLFTILKRPDLVSIYFKSLRL